MRILNLDLFGMFKVLPTVHCGAMNKTLARKSLLLLSSPPLNSRINIFKVLKSTSAVKDALSLDKVGQKFDLQGWVKSARIQKINTFIDLDDGLTIGGQRLQIVAKTEQVPSELTYHSAISVSGKLRKSDHPGQEVELEAENIEVVSSVNLDDYPFQPRKRYEDELPRTFPQYRHSDVLTLRQDHRIVGSLIGTLSQAPRQVQQSGLPLLLMPEEIDLLLQQNVISLFRFKNPESFSDEYRNKFQLQREMNFQSQVEVFKEDRKSEIHRMADKIVEGKKRKKTRKSSEEIVILNDVSEDNETILQREIDKIGDLPRHQALLQTFTEQPWLSFEQDNLEEIEWIYPTNCDLKRRKTFAKLWTNGFFITDGTKFGGDFLAYPGDPIQFHAKYIVICCEKNPENMSQNDLVAKSRMGTGVKKIPLLAFMAGGAKNEQVKFKAIKWTEKLL